MSKLNQPTPPKPVTDLSPRVVSLARRIDRLPPGHYTIELVKPDMRGEAWRAQITRIEDLFDLVLQPRED